MSERPNFYLLLDLDPAIDEWPTIQQRIAEKQQIWSKDRTMGNPKARRRAEVSLALLQEMELLKDPEFRRQEAREAVRQRQAASHERTRELDEAIDLLKTGSGVCNEAQLNKLIQRFAGVFTAAEISRRLRNACVQIESPPRSNPKPRPVKKQIDKVTATKIRQDLDQLGLATLYDFLELRPQSSPRSLCERAEEIYKENQRLGRTDANASVSNTLAGICKSLFRSDEEKARYDNYLAIEAMEGLRHNIELAGVNGFLTPQEMDILIRQARQRGVSAEDARTFVEDYAAARKWEVRGAKLSPEKTRIEADGSNDEAAEECSSPPQTEKPVSAAIDGISALSSLAREDTSQGRRTREPEQERLTTLRSKTVTNVTSKSFGVVVFNQWSREVVANLIQCDDKVPKSSSLEVKTYEEGLRSMELRCMENTLRQQEAEIEECIEVGTAVLEFGRPLPKDSLVRITFELGPDGLLTLRGKDLTTGSEVQASFQTTTILTPEQLSASRQRNMNIEVTRGRPVRTVSTPLSKGSSPEKIAKRLRNQVFFSYSHEDKAWLDRLRTMLTPLVRNGISCWDDTKIVSGKDWRGEIANALASAKVAVLLVSQSFLASDFIEQNELPPLLKAAKEEGLSIFWLCINLCLYDETIIQRYQAVHDPAEPLDSMERHQQDRVLLQLCKQIKAAMETARSSN
ncbi:MAG TPA: toll/interleukin-1 receptor domain-containing protein [Thermoanaerobaculia bacterium]|nr:toll/interleukin-1 receptor domain-containing protein [Thermoanaerobaculia bacterium]